ncbi:Putative adenylate kinase [uncultured archaeon]|nr:Putative adenylate kinase [uncultured archaeon]
MRSSLPEKIVITGTPGVGKTTIAKLLSKKTGLKYISANDFLKKYKGIKKHVADLKKLKKLSKIKGIIEGHLCCEVKIHSKIFVLRLDPKILEQRLKKRGYSRKKIYDNLLSEILDYCLIVSEKKYPQVIQINCTKKTPEQIANEIIKEKKSKDPHWLTTLEESFLKE